jgi:Skp family chaperone for outer membrane proteins
MKVIALFCLLVLTGCAQTYYSAWEKLGVEKRDILVDRVDNAKEAQVDAQAEFTSALDQFSQLINYDGGELEAVYDDLKGQYESAKDAANNVTDRIDKVENVADALFKEWEAELDLYTNANLRRDSAAKLRDTKRQYQDMLRAMRKVEGAMPPVLNALQNNVLYLKHNLNAAAVGALRGELNAIQQEVSQLVAEMNVAIKQSDAFIASMKG